MLYNMLGSHNLIYLKKRLCKRVSVRIASKDGGGFKKANKCEQVGYTGKWSSAWFPSSAGRAYASSCTSASAERQDRKGYQYFGTSSPLTTPDSGH